MRKLMLSLLLATGCSSGSKNVCPLVSCPYFPSVLLHVVDASGAPVPEPAGSSVPPTPFSVDGMPLGAGCSLTDADGGACATWDLTVYGMKTIHVTFPGYQPADVAVDVPGPTGSCCPGPIQVVEKTVTLTKQ